MITLNKSCVGGAIVNESRRWDGALRVMGALRYQKEQKGLGMTPLTVCSGRRTRRYSGIAEENRSHI